MGIHGRWFIVDRGPDPLEFLPVDPVWTVPELVIAEPATKRKMAHWHTSNTWTIFTIDGTYLYRLHHKKWSSQAQQMGSVMVGWPAPCGQFPANVGVLNHSWKHKLIKSCYDKLGPLLSSIVLCRLEDRLLPYGVLLGFYTTHFTTPWKGGCLSGPPLWRESSLL